MMHGERNNTRLDFSNLWVILLHSKCFQNSIDDLDNKEHNDVNDDTTAADDDDGDNTDDDGSVGINIGISG